MKNEQLEGTKAYRAFREDHRRYGWQPDKSDRAPSRWGEAYRLISEWGVIHYQAVGTVDIVVVNPSAFLPVRFFDTRIGPAYGVTGGALGVWMGLVLATGGMASQNITPLADPVWAVLVTVLVPALMGLYLSRMAIAMAAGAVRSRDLLWSSKRIRRVAAPQHINLIKEVDDALSNLGASPYEIREVMWEAAISPERATLIRDMLVNRAPDTLSGVMIHPDGTITTHHWPLDSKNFPEDIYTIVGGQFDQVLLGNSLVAWVPRAETERDNLSAERLGLAHGAPQKMHGTVLVTGTDPRELSVRQVLDIADSSSAPEVELERKRPRRPHGLPGSWDDTIYP